MEMINEKDNLFCNIKTDVGSVKRREVLLRHQKCSLNFGIFECFRNQIFLRVLKIHGTSEFSKF